MKKEQLAQLVINFGAKRNYFLTQPVKPIKPYAGYWVGLTFTIPENYEVFIDHMVNQYGNICNYNQFILVERDDNEYHIFYPSVLCRTIPEFDESNNWTGKHHSVDGTVVDFVQKFTDMNSAIKELVGKKIRISALRRVRTSFGWKSLPTFDFVD